MFGMPSNSYEDLCTQRIILSYGMGKTGIGTTKIFLPSREIALTVLTKPGSKKWAEETGYTYTPIQISPSQSLLDNLYQERGAAKELFYLSKEDEDQYVNDVALLRRVNNT